MKLSTKLLCTLLIQDLQLWVHLGCSAEDKFHSQLVNINVDFTFKFPSVGFINDRLKDTIYLLSGSSAEYTTACSKQQFNLIEYFTCDVYIIISKPLM
ncbi:dihydroneopterin aldolase [Wolbachia endosymbiont of Mansonella ozzardi]|uniref:dihydroneopterin aldolase n=1 Tax=Wolbachia endosymbiont of Mansonella ozzardi TaxID=137464 RepID=UPI001CE0EE72|nr:dihydroneopterin aldolase [Wolbachia endosymbiont of Mansonella ozzardi]